MWKRSRPRDASSSQKRQPTIPLPTTTTRTGSASERELGRGSASACDAASRLSEVSWSFDLVRSIAVLLAWPGQKTALGLRGIAPARSGRRCPRTNRLWLDLTFASAGPVVSDAVQPTDRESNRRAARMKPAIRSKDRGFLWTSPHPRHGRVLIG